MRKHNGMRPQDIAILLKIIALNTSNWQITSIAHALHISNSEISESLNRNRLAGLIDYNKKIVNRNSLFEFLEHGIKYVFPVEPGILTKGIPTAHSHPFMKNEFISEMNYVWPDTDGEVVGLTIEPLYLKQVHAIKDDVLFYKLLAMVDVLRVGRAREIKIAAGEIKKILLP